MSEEKSVFSNLIFIHQAIQTKKIRKKFMKKYYLNALNAKKKKHSLYTNI